MGSSKKHKEKDREREHKRKRRHRSRSPGREKGEKHHRRHGHRDRDRDKQERDHPDLAVLEEYKNEFDAYKYRTYETSGYAHGYDYNEGEVEEVIDVDRPTIVIDDDEAPEQSTGEGLSLSIAEANKVRAKLGLKPLDVKTDKSEPKIPFLGDDDTAEEAKPKKEDVHMPAKNLANEKKAAKLKEKLETSKQKRKIKEKLNKVKLLGDSDSGDDDMKAWVKKSRKLAKEKIIADKRAKLLEEMDEEFGVQDLIEEEFKDKRKGYSSKDLRGIKIEHDMGSFRQGKSVVLTLKDSGILDEDYKDTLVNVNMVDDEKYMKNLENKKKKPMYNPYDDDEFDEDGMPKMRHTLSKYDEEIEGEKKKSFAIGIDKFNSMENQDQIERIRKQLQQDTLSVPSLILASEYFTPEEMTTKFKKVKKKVRKIRKKSEILKADDLMPQNISEVDYGSRSRGRGINRIVEQDETNEDVADEEYLYGEKKETELIEEPMEIENNIQDFTEPQNLGVVPEADILGPDEDLSGVVIEEDTADLELQSALSKTRKIKLKKEPVAQRVAEHVQSQVLNNSVDNDMGGQIILNSTSEFCKNLGDIPTYGLAGNREEERDEVLDEELELMHQRMKEQEDNMTGWAEVDIDDRPVDIMNEETAVIDDEPVVNTGLGTALQLAVKKGYLQQEKTKSTVAPKHLHQAQNYSIEDKRYDDLDEKFKKRDRYIGSLSDFKDKDGYKPDVKIEYVDETGRIMSSKEAFRYLSHRFHGKGSGKKKTEKRMKKLDEVNLMKSMSSTDTPLNTLALLQEKQKAEKTPFVLLSGNKGMQSTSIAKPH